MNLLFYVFRCNCNVVFRILYFEQFAAGRRHVVYLSFAGSTVIRSTTMMLLQASRKRKGLKADRRGVVQEDFLSNRELFCT